MGVQPWNPSNVTEWLWQRIYSWAASTDLWHAADTSHLFYSIQNASQCSCVNRTFLAMLKTAVSDLQYDWESYLSACLCTFQPCMSAPALDLNSFLQYGYDSANGLRDREYWTRLTRKSMSWWMRGRVTGLYQWKHLQPGECWKLQSVTWL